MKRILMCVMVLCCAWPVTAGIVLEMQITDLTSTETSKASMTIEGKSLRMDFPPADGGDKGEMIFLGGSQEMLIVDRQKRNYVVVNEQQVTALAKQLSQIKAETEKLLADMPEAQREQMKQMTQAPMPDSRTQRKPSELRKTGDKQSINGYRCAKYEVWQDGVKLRELWVTRWRKLLGGDEVKAAFEELADFFEALLDSMPMAGDRVMPDPTFEHLKAVKGFPVKTVGFSNGVAVSESLFQGISERAMAPDDFKPPAGFTRRNLLPQAR